jgi:uncharacterized protein (TIGR03000 family)
MFKQCFSAFGGLAVAAAALLLTPQSTLAQHGGGHGGGGHGGGGHGGGGHGGGGHASGWHGGGGHPGGWHDGGWHDGWHGGHRGFYGYGFGLGYPWYYGGYYPWSYGYSDYPWHDGGYNYFEPYYYPYYGTPSYGYAPYYGSGSYTYQAPPSPDNAAHMTVRVPPDAQVWFENEATTQRGAVRNFDSPELAPGRDFTYDIRARWRQGDREVDQTRHVLVQAGTHVTVDFTAPAADQRQTTPTASSEL